MWLCLPELYYKGCSPQVLLPDIWDICEANRVALGENANHDNADANEEPASLSDFLSMSPLQFTQFASAAPLSDITAAHFLQDLQAVLDDDPRFRQSFLVHHLKPKSDNPVHDARSRAGRPIAWYWAINPLERLLTDLDMEGWVGSVSVEFCSNDKVLLWQPQALKQCLDHLLPEVEAGLTEELSNKRESAQLAVTHALGDTTLDISSAKQPFLYIQLRNHFRTESERRPGWKAFTPVDTFPQKIQGLLQAAMAAESQCFKLADATGGDVLATLTVHVKLAQMERALTTFPATKELLYRLPREAWWWVAISMRALASRIINCMLFLGVSVQLESTLYGSS